jgi:hypothetical protein
MSLFQEMGMRFWFEKAEAKMPALEGARKQGRANAMSALGQKQTSRLVRVMSALPPKADIAECRRYVRFVPKADSCSAAAVANRTIGAPNIGHAPTCCGCSNIVGKHYLNYVRI